MESLLSLATLGWDTGLAVMLEAEGWSTSRLGNSEGSEMSIPKVIKGLAAKGVHVEFVDMEDLVGGTHAMARLGWPHKPRSVKQACL